MNTNHRKECSAVIETFDTRNAFETVFGIVELREMIFVHLHLEELYSTRRVSKKWRDVIDSSVLLQRLMYKKPTLDISQHNTFVFQTQSGGIQLSAPSTTLNPIMSRTIIMPRDGLIVNCATLDPRAQTSQKTAAVENLLEWRMALTQDTATQQLIDDTEHPFRFLADLPGESRVRCNDYIRQQAWKSMFFSQPLVQEIKFDHPCSWKAATKTRKDGIRMIDVLSAWEDFGDSIKVPGCKEFEILLPMYQQDDRQGTHGYWDTLHRALKTKLACRFE